MSNYTEGPWQSHSDYTVDSRLLIVGGIDGPDDGQMHYTPVCEVISDRGHGDGPDLMEAFANARLIAAAPSLLRALKRVLATVEHMYHTNPDPDDSLWADVLACRKAIKEAQS